MITHKILNRDPKDVILKAFRLLDDDETGKISFKNLKLISDVDVDGSGTVGFEEFFNMLLHQPGSPPAQTSNTSSTSSRGSSRTENRDSQTRSAPSRQSLRSWNPGQA